MMDTQQESPRTDQYSDLSGVILGCCFEVMAELGSGFLENVYKNALFILLKEKGLQVTTEQLFEVHYRQHVIGKYKADLIVENSVIIELKCCSCLLPEHQAQLINYLKVANIPVGLLVNFNSKKLEYHRLQHPTFFSENTK